MIPEVHRKVISKWLKWVVLRPNCGFYVRFSPPTRITAEFHAFPAASAAAESWQQCSRPSRSRFRACEGSFRVKNGQKKSFWYTEWMRIVSCGFFGLEIKIPPRCCSLPLNKGAGACKVPWVHGHFGLMATLTITKKWWFWKTSHWIDVRKAVKSTLFLHMFAIFVAQVREV